MVSMDMNYIDYFNYVVRCRDEYVNYLVEKSVVYYLCYQVLKKSKYPSLILDNTKVDLKVVRENVINNTQDILRGIDLTIKWLDDDTIKKLKFEHGWDAHKYIMEEAHIGSIFDIPVMPSKFSSAHIESYGKEENFKDKVYKKIYLVDNWETETVESSYFHELGHALVDRNWYTVMNPLFREYVPHCLEMYYNFFILKDPERFIKKLVPRMITRADNCDVLSVFDGTLSILDERELPYLIALFLSCITFEKYYDFNFQEKREIESDFKSVLNGEWPLEKLLEKYDINLHTDESIKLFKKTIERVNSYTL